MTGNNPAPWHASSVALMADTLVEPTFTVRMWNGVGTTMVTIPAYDVQVSLSATRAPFGTATFKTTLPKTWAGVTWPAIGAVAINSPASAVRRTTPVEIRAGWRHLIGGVMTDDQQTIMYGYVSATERRSTPDGTVIQWSVVTADEQWDYPSHRTYSGPNSTYTRLKQVTDAFAASGDPWTVSPVLVEGTLNTPTSAQLTPFRAADMGVGDTLIEYFRQLAQMLGQTIRPDWRATTLRLRVDAEPTFDADNALTLAAAEEYSEIATQDTWGTVLNLRAQWYSSGEQKTAARQYVNADVGFPIAAPTFGTSPAVAQDGTVWVKPPAGTLPTSPTWPPAALWMRRIYTRNALIRTVTSRAAWWIQPYDVVRYTAQPGSLLPVWVYVETVTFNLDDGSMVLVGPQSDAIE